MSSEVLLPWSWMVATSLVIVATVCFALNRGERLSMGGVSLPFIGDTTQFMRSGPRDFLQERLARYGDPFNISFMGRKFTVLNSPEAIKFVLSSAHTAFPAGYTKQFRYLLAEGKFADPRHPYFRKAVLAVASKEGLLNLLPYISSLAEKTVKSWEHQAVVNTCEEIRKFVFTVMMHIAWRDVAEDSEEMEQIKHETGVIFRGIMSLPINFPGFFFHKALKTKQALVARIQKTIAKRRETGSEVDDYLNALMNIREVEVPDYDICCIMLGFMFAAQATTAALIPWVVKYLHDFPEVRQRVQDEQDGIRRKIIEDKSLTWFKPKTSMPYTMQVINEVLRIESIAAFVPRQANKDVDYNGFAFRKNSYLWASLSSVHLNPEYYPNPLEFDPSRFEEKPKPNTYMPFGQGPHLCPGSELAITETLFMIHHLITNYSWERVGPDHPGSAWQMLTRGPVGGFPIVVKRRAT